MAQFVQRAAQIQTLALQLGQGLEQQRRQDPGKGAVTVAQRFDESLRLLHFPGIGASSPVETPRPALQAGRVQRLDGHPAEPGQPVRPGQGIRPGSEGETVAGIAPHQGFDLDHGMLPGYRRDLVQAGEDQQAGLLVEETLEE